MQPRRARRFVWTAIRVLLTAGFVAWLVTWIDWAQVRAAFARVSAVETAWAFLLVPPVAGLALRWWLILTAAGLRVPFAGVVRLVWVGAFFNNFLPGGAGGDLARIAIAAGETERKATVVGTVIVDRAVGIVTLLGMGLAAALAQWGRPGMVQAAAILAGILGAGAAGLAVYFSPWLRRSRAGRWLREHLPGRDRLREAEVPLRALAARPARLAACLALSILGQAVAISVLAGIARAMDLEAVRWAHLLAVVPIVFTVNALPISLGGWGVGEAAYVQLLSPAGVASGEAVALALLFRMAGIAVSLPGAAVFATGRSRPGIER